MRGKNDRISRGYKKIFSWWLNRFSHFYIFHVKNTFFSTVSVNCVIVPIVKLLRVTRNYFFGKVVQWWNLTHGTRSSRIFSHRNSSLYPSKLSNRLYFFSQKKFIGYIFYVVLIKFTTLVRISFSTPSIRTKKSFFSFLKNSVWWRYFFKNKKKIFL